MLLIEMSMFFYMGLKGRRRWDFAGALKWHEQGSSLQAAEFNTKIVRGLL
jgi:hypothetical protein